VAYLQPFVISEGALPQEGRVLRADERKVNDCGNDRICGNQA
jgi:hypothetical protein